MWIWNHKWWLIDLLLGIFKENKVNLSYTLVCFRKTLSHQDMCVYIYLNILTTKFLVTVKFYIGPLYTFFPLLFLSGKYDIFTQYKIYFVGFC